MIAGAGSGKTRALSRRFAYLVGEAGVLPGGILCVTFTNRAAGEMRQRIRALTGDSDTGFIGTFHSFCVSVLKEESHAVQYPKSFLVIDNSDIDAMLAEIYEERGLTLRDCTFAAARDAIEMRKTKQEPLYYLDMISMDPAALRRKYDEARSAGDIIFYGYLYREKKCFALDYNDLINFTLAIFDAHPDICRKWQQKLEYIMVDEFQDIDDLQYRLMQVLCGWHRNLFVVGDPDQTIYTWRGASVRYLLDFERDFPGTKTIRMLRNYRSRPEILAAANALISRNRDRIPKDLVPVRPAGEKPVWHHAETAEKEAGWIAAQIRELAEKGTAYRDIAVLYRAHYVSRTLEDIFLREKIPYVLYSGVPFYSRAEVKDALSYLRFAACRDDLSFARIANNPRRNLGRLRMQALRQTAEENRCSLYDALCLCADRPDFQNTKARQLIALAEKYTPLCASMAPSDLLSALLGESGYEKALRTQGSGERLDNLAELKQALLEYEATIGEEAVLDSFLAHVALFSGTDRASERDAVRCMTVHTAKGLEFPNVFLCSLEEDVFPSKKTRTPEAMEEERRLAFVAATRAEDGLFLSDSEGQGEGFAFRVPSRFVLDDIPPALLRIEDPPPERLVKAAREKIRLSGRTAAAGEIYGPGERVVSAVLGAGTVQRYEEQKDAYVIRFDALPTERTISRRVLLTREGAAGGESGAFPERS